MTSSQYTYTNVDQDVGTLNVDCELSAPLHQASEALAPESRPEQEPSRSLASRRVVRIVACSALAVAGAVAVARAALGANPLLNLHDKMQGGGDLVSEEGAMLHANTSETTQLNMFGWGRPSYGYGRPAYGTPNGMRPGYGRPTPQAVASSRASCCAGVPGGVCCVDYPPVCCGVQQRCNMGQCVPAAYGRPMGGGAMGYGQPAAPMGSGMARPAYPGAGLQRPGMLSGLMGMLRR